MTQKESYMTTNSYITSWQSPLGPITIASDGEALIGLWFDGQKYDRATLKNKQAKTKELPVFAQTIQWLETYFAGQIPSFSPPLKVEGSPFRQLVAEIMLTIPYGKTMTYGEIAKEAAKRMGKESMSAQAVGGAVGHNPISIIIPCHRVMGVGGSLTGYAGGIEKKQWMLELEHKKDDV